MTNEENNLPDLYSPEEFQRWYLHNSRAGVSIENAINFLSCQNTNIAFLRCGFIAYWCKHSLLGSFLDKALASEEKAIEVYAKSLIGYLHLSKLGILGRNSEIEGVVDLIPMLRRSIADLLIGPLTPFTRESEAAARTTLAAALMIRGDYDAATQEAAEALFWARQINAPISILRARAQLIKARTNAGYVSEALLLLMQERGNTDRAEHFFVEQEALLAYHLSHLGAYEAALKALGDISASVGDQPRVEFYVQLVESLTGVSNLQMEIPQGHGADLLKGWIIHAMQFLGRAAGLPRLNQYAAKRYELLDEAIRIARTAENLTFVWRELLQRWIIGLAHLWQGKTSIALHGVLETKPPAPDWLDIRMLLAGLRLELSLSLNHPELRPRRYADELREVFDHASRIPYASRKGLATWLMRWHPLAAAYGAVMPNPIPELAPATDMILRTGCTNSVYGLTMPPVYAAELVLRCFGFDLRREAGFVQAPLNKTQIAQRDRLMTTYGKAPYWRPVVSAAHLAYGLMKAAEGREEYGIVARGLIADFGDVPDTKAGYAEEEMERIRLALQMLLEERHDHKEFARQLLAG